MKRRIRLILRLLESELNQYLAICEPKDRQSIRCALWLAGFMRGYMK